MAVFKYTFTSASSPFSTFEVVRIAIRKCHLPWQSPLDEAPAAAAYAGMGWDASMPPMQL
jgi:hypothetical protein